MKPAEFAIVDNKTSKNLVIFDKQYKYTTL